VPFGPAPSLNSQAARYACALVCNPLRSLQPAPSRLGFAFQIRISGKREVSEIGILNGKAKKENKGKKGRLNSKFKTGFHLR